MHKRVPSRGISHMERAVPKNERFAHVQSTVNTGMTVKNVKVLTARQFAMRRDEIFYRITKAQMTDLYNEYEHVEEENTDIRDMVDDDRSCTVVTYAEEEGASYERPYLIIDVREPDQYSRCHLTQARNFPYTWMRRDQTMYELNNFKNKEGLLIIVYCDDERISCDAAKMLVDRGTDNIYCLSGGLVEFAPQYPAFIEGVSPFSPKKSPRAKGGLTRISEHRDIMGNESPRSYTGGKHPPLTTLNLQKKQLSDKQARTSPRSPRNRGSDSSYGGSTYRDGYSRSEVSNQTNRSVAESVISRASARKGKF